MKVNLILKINEQTKCMIIPSIAICARFYALPTLAFHPVLSNIGTTFYELARFLSLCNSLTYSHCK